ncbi:MAG: response regulator [Acetivibrio sp.]
MKKVRGKVRKITFLIVIIIMSSFPKQVKAAENKTIKVGYVGYEGFINKNENQEFEGYAVDYLNEIAKYTGWNYEYVYASWSDCQRLLKEEKLDMICSAQYQKERGEIYDYSRYRLGVVQVTLYTRPDNEELYYEDYEHFNAKKIAFLEGSLNIDAFREYALRKGFIYSPVFFKSDTEMKKALLEKKVDAIATEHMVRHDDLKLIGKFGCEPYYIMLYKNSPYTKSVNFAINEIMSNNIEFESQLFKKYYGNSILEKDTYFTRDEVEFIKEGHVFTVGNLPNRYPISDYNEKTKELTGITEDLLYKIEEISGLKFQLEPILVNEKPLHALELGKFDLVAGIIRTDNFLKDSKIRVSDTLMESKIATLIRKGDGYHPKKNLTVAVKKSFQAMQEYIIKNHPNYKISYYETDQDCLNALKNKEVDILMQNVYVLNYLLQKPLYQDLEMVPTSYIEEKNAIASLTSADPRLISIINKSIRIITEDDINSIVIANTTGKPYVLTDQDLLYKYWVPILLVGISFSICILLLIIIIVNRQTSLKKMSEKNKQLADAVKQAEHATRAKSNFLSRMSHEIRTPMNAIIGITTLCGKHSGEKEKVEEYLDKLAASSRHLLNIINDVLDMSAIESDKIKISSAPFDLKQIISSITGIYYTQAKDKGIKFEVVLENIMYENLKGDQLRLNQILLNLLSNAMKFTPSGGNIKLIVNQKQTKEDCVFCHFEVKDSGCGIKEEDKSRIFLPFEQENSMTSQKYGGTGLGLSITKNLVDLMQGAIRLESKEGKGSAFTVELPFHIIEQKQEKLLSSLENIRVLVVDDEKEALEYTATVLERLNLSYTLASDGEQAFECLKLAREEKKPYKLCLVDWKMPSMNGLEVTKKIREEYEEDAMIIIASAYNMNEMQKEVLSAGANLCISKPIFQSTIYNLISSMVNGDFTKCTAEADKYDFTGCRILLVEDTDFNREIAVELLEMVGAKVTCAVNGKEAVELLEKVEDNTYDIVLMDIQMPIMNGLEATKAIRRFHRDYTRNLPILAMTANAFMEDVAASLSAGMNDHITKPIDTDILYSVIQKYWKR